MTNYQRNLVNEVRKGLELTEKERNDTYGTTGWKLFIKALCDEVEAKGL